MIVPHLTRVWRLMFSPGVGENGVSQVGLLADLGVELCDHHVVALEDK
jgi:hypothetical protein